MDAKPNERKKLSHDEAVTVAMAKPTEIARILSVLDCNRGYMNPYSEVAEPLQFEAYKRAIDGVASQRAKTKEKVKQIIYKKRESGHTINKAPSNRPHFNNSNNQYSSRTRTGEKNYRDNSQFNKY